MFLHPIIVTSILSAGHMLANGAFSSKCDHLSLCGDVLRATCQDDAGVAHATTFDLNSCVNFENTIWCDGFAPLPFGGSCQQCALNGTALWCICLELTGLGSEWNWVTIGLDGCLNVDDGQISCVIP